MKIWNSDLKQILSKFWPLPRRKSGNQNMMFFFLKFYHLVFFLPFTSHLCFIHFFSEKHVNKFLKFKNIKRIRISVWLKPMYIHVCTRKCSTKIVTKRYTNLLPYQSSKLNTIRLLYWPCLASCQYPVNIHNNSGQH